MTALLGVQRNLTAGEIVGQVLLVLNDQQIEIGRDRINLVFMGQGEPFLNYENFIRAVQLLVEGAGIPESRMTVSTSGIVPRIADFGAEPVRPHLAISLNASNDDLRERIMPINRKWKLAELLEAARQFPLRSRERLTFEYVLLSGVNDAPENAREVVALLARHPCQGQSHRPQSRAGDSLSDSHPPQPWNLSSRSSSPPASPPTSAVPAGSTSTPPADS